MVESNVFQMWRANEQQTLKDSSHHLRPRTFGCVSPFQEQPLHAIRDVSHVLTTKYLSREAEVNDMVAFEAMQIRKTAEQIRNGDCVLAGGTPGINRLDPLLRSPSPKRSVAFGHLA